MIAAVQADPQVVSWFQLEPGSSFLTGLNANQENFKQAAVIGLTDQRWAFTRIAGNALFGCNPEDGWCGERDLATETEIAYDSLFAAEFIAALTAQHYCCQGQQTACDFWNDLARAFGNVIGTMSMIDGYYNYFIDYPDSTQYAGTSDAIVQGSSQFYPYASAVQYSIPDADSHTGALKSDHVRDKLGAALASTLFNVPTQTSCVFVVSNSPDLFSSNAGTGSFTVSGATGCNWSAASQASWISVTSGVNGTTGGTVGFFRSRKFDDNTTEWNYPGWKSNIHGAIYGESRRHMLLRSLTGAGGCRTRSRNQQHRGGHHLNWVPVVGGFKLELANDNSWRKRNREWYLYVDSCCQR